MLKRYWKYLRQVKEFRGEIMIQIYSKEQNGALKPGYRTNLVSSWIPALDSGKVREKLKKGGAIVADIGCGHGISTVIMAKAYPNSKFIGFDNHSASIERAIELAKEERIK